MRNRETVRARQVISTEAMGYCVPQYLYARMIDHMASELTPTEAAKIVTTKKSTQAQKKATKKTTTKVKRTATAPTTVPEPDTESAPEPVPESTPESTQRQFASQYYQEDKYIYWIDVNELI